MFYLIDFDSLRYIPSGQRNPKGYTDQMVYPQVVEKLRKVSKNNIIVGLTNHEQVSFGKKEFTAWEFETEFLRIIGAKIYDIKMNLYNPEGSYSHKYTDNRWWSQPDILRKYLAEANMKPKDFCIISSKARDRNIATILSFNFEWAHSFFEWNISHLERVGEELHWRPDSIKSVIKNTIELEYNSNGTRGKRVFPKDAIVYLEYGLNYQLKEMNSNEKNR
jgi:hypothetical protein